LPKPLQWRPIDKARYRDLLIRSIRQVLQSLGMNEAELSSLADEGEDASLAEN